MVKEGTKRMIPVEKIMKKKSLNPNPFSPLCGEIEKIRMVRKGGTKQKIPIVKIHNKEYLRVTCTKRREGLFSKTSQFCLLSGAQIAILATPPSAESNVSFYSFGHSSVDGLVSAFLTGQRPLPEDNKQMTDDVGLCLTRKDLGLGFWWENESLAQSENPEELRDAINNMSKLLNSLKKLNTLNDIQRYHTGQAFVDDEDLKKNEKSTQEPDHTLNLQSTSSVGDELPENSNEIPEEQDQILAICESLCVTDNINNALPQGNLDNNQEMDIDQLIDFDTNFESDLDYWFSKYTTDQELEETTTSPLTISEAVDDISMGKTTNPNLCSDSQGVEDGDLVLQRCLDDDNLRFSDFINDLTTIAAI